MREIETDYLVVGAGASGMAFVDALIAAADVDVVIVDRRHSPGGHWLDDYPFVRLHQPSANYGVSSRTLGHDRIDEAGPNAGFYERATAGEVCDYYSRVLREDLLPSGRVRFLGMTDYRGADDQGHHLRSLLTGEETLVKVRRRFVDATYVESVIPSRHTPAFSADEDVRLIPPNDLVDLDEPAGGFTVIGCGKTAMDTCNWLLDEGVDADSIQWFRPRDPWLFDRSAIQPLELVGSYMHMQGCFVRAAAEAADAADWFHRMEADGNFIRIDAAVEPEVFRGATISSEEVDALRTIERVVPRRRVLHIGMNRIVTDDGDLTAEPDRVFVDCSAPGLPPTIPCPVFDGRRITLQQVTIGIVPWGAATIGAVEARAEDDVSKNLLCPPLTFTGQAADVLNLAHIGMTGLIARTSDPDMSAWTEGCRLNPGRGAADHIDDPRVEDGFAMMGTYLGAALENLARHAASALAAVQLS